MTKRSPNLREKYLDAERLFRKYWEMGDKRSVAILTEWAKHEGMVSKHGTDPTPMGIWKAMWRWASLKENKSIAWEIYITAVPEELQLTQKQWEWNMINVRIPSAWQHPTNAKKDKFLKENGWVE